VGSRFERFWAGLFGVMSLIFIATCAVLIYWGPKLVSLVICHNSLKTLMIVVPIVIITIPIVFFAIEHIARCSIFKNFNLKFRILIGVIVFVVIISAIVMLFVYDGDIVVKAQDGAVYLCRNTYSYYADVKFQNGSNIPNCVFQKADSICKNEDDPFRHLSNFVSVNGTLGAYVCWPTTSTDGANECGKIGWYSFAFREFGLLFFVVFIFILNLQTIVCAPCLERYKRIKPMWAKIETNSLLTNDFNYENSSI